MSNTLDRFFQQRLDSLAAAALSAIGGTAVALAAAVVYEQVWQPLQFSSARGLVRIWASEGAKQRSAITPAIGSLLERSTSLAEVASFAGHISGFGSDGASVQAAAVTGTFFSVLDAVPIDGRLLVPSDDHPAAPPVCVLSRSRWRQEFGDTYFPGQRVRVDGTDREVVGIVSDDLDFPGTMTEVWLPLSTGLMADLRSDARGLGGIARLKTGESPRTANVELELLSAASSQPSGEVARIWCEPLSESLGLRTRASVRLLGMGVLLLLIATIGNLVALQLTTLRSQRASLAIRSALGAQRHRLVSASLMDMARPVLLGSVVAVPTAWVVGRSIQAPRELMLAGAALANGAAIISLAATSFISLRTASIDSEHRSGGMRWLVLLETACAYCLVAMTVALALHHWRLSSAELGFASDLVVVEVRFPVDRFPLDVGDPSTWSGNHRRAEQLLALYRREPLLSKSALGMVYPLTPGWTRRYVAPRGRGEIRFRVVGGRYFEVAQIDLVRGREFSDSDRLGRPAVVILNQLAGELLFGEDDPLGSSLVIANVERQVAGVVENTRFLDIGLPPEPAVFVPYSQTPSGFFFLTVRSPTAGARVQSRVRSITKNVVPGAQVMMGPRIEDIVASRLGGAWRRTLLMALGGVTIVVLSLIATFVLSSTLGMMTRREMAIRRAMGCRPMKVTGALVWKSMWPVLGGTMVGASTGIVIMQVLLPVVGVDLVTGLAAQGAAIVPGVLLSLAVALPRAMSCARSPLARLLSSA